MTVKEMGVEDIPHVVSFLAGTDEAFMHQWGGGRWYTYPVTVDQMERQYALRSANTRYYLFMENDEPIGSAELDFINWEDRHCKVCRFIIRREYRSKGYGKRALKALVNHAFSGMDMKTVGLTVFDFNLEAVHCYKRTGFMETGRETRPNGWVAIHMEMGNPNGADVY